MELEKIIHKSNNKHLVICGATATGKSELAVRLADKLDCIIINADSMQVYKELPLLTAQPLESAIQHKLYGVISCQDEFSVNIWLNLVKNELQNSTKRVIFVGGSGMYIKALINGISQLPDISQETRNFVYRLSMSGVDLHNMLASVDRPLAERVHKNDIKRIQRGLMVYYETKVPLSQWHIENIGASKRDEFFLINKEVPRDLIYRNCNKRFLDSLYNGVLEEVENAIKVGCSSTASKILGMEEIVAYLENKSTLENSTILAQQKIRNYAKRQLTWFRHQFIYDCIVN
ncbi:tRNA dimethylallyltransferase [Candidatus Cyrtobacter comes]|uniref:tRNA dimethylallyltransferase n=1 Tax=Candidatus Cyrtobacter comes TaxID=675776 RepID=A0ABU5L9H6_9RICK|nr:tRNA (adenosine(37)-N6)-dimethylallyltransferase MiaA [Candidatus Cyrtobacter comes]MDZ5762560.1 tRNA dimethylallyltransferase [Candidatus Cyrtobacter comes]